MQGRWWWGLVGPVVALACAAAQASAPTVYRPILTSVLEARP